MARKENRLSLFETDYDKIDIERIRLDRSSNTTSLKFDDGHNFYSFNYSKSTLYRKFFIPQNAYELTVDIIDDPYTLLLELFDKKRLSSATDKLVRGVDYVVLPLYGIHKKQKFVYEKSGLNQWNAEGRERDHGEVYIPIPIEIHRQFPDFFPDTKVVFNLEIPTEEVFRAKVCQANSKALMTNPNKAMSDWLLRKILKLEVGKLATIERLNELGFDSVIIYKDDTNKYRIDKAGLNSYEAFINNEYFDFI